MKRFALAFSMMVLGSVAQAMPIPIELFREAEPRVFRSQIPAERSPAVDRWINYFADYDHERFDRFMQRGALYKTLIQDTLVESGVPPEMYYLAMIESGFALKAKSRARAVGIWQFGAPTARLYGLRVDRDVDERMDIIRATRAAAHLLRGLKSEFGSWNLAMAAYNCGTGCVHRAIRRGGTRDFYRLARRGLLPSETANYVPKFQAAMAIAKEPERYGFRRKQSYEFPLVARVHVGNRVDVSEIARRHRVPVHMILALNPHLIRGRTPAGSRGYEIWIPRGYRHRVAEL